MHGVTIIFSTDYTRYLYHARINVGTCYTSSLQHIFCPNKKEIEETNRLHFQDSYNMFIEFNLELRNMKTMSIRTAIFRTKLENFESYSFYYMRSV